MRKPIPPLSTIHTIALDFDGVFTDNAVFVDQDGRETVRCNRADGLAFDFVRAFQESGRMQAECLIVSKESNAVVQERARKMRLACHHGIGDKLTFLQQYLAERLPAVREPFDGLVYVGNDLNDLPVMRRAGYAVAPADAHPRVLDVAHLVLDERGGHGFVRAFIERLLRITELSDEEIDGLVSDR